jgi:hypothetical protein
VWPVGLSGLLLSPQYKNYRLLGFIFLFVLLLFILLQGKSYYTLGLYPVLMAAGSIIWETWTRAGGRKWFRPLLLGIPLALTIPVFPIIFPVLSPEETAAYALKFKNLGILRWEDGKDHDLPQDFADMLGWQEMTELVAGAYAQIPPGARSQTIILCDNYGEAGAIDYYGRRYNLPPARSLNASYLLWLPQPLRFRHVILVGDNPSAEDRAHFKKIENIGEVTNPFAREKGATVMLLWEGNDTIVNKVNQRIRQERAKFGQ